MNEAERSTYLFGIRGLIPGTTWTTGKRPFESMASWRHPADRRQLVAERKKSRALEKERAGARSVPAEGSRLADPSQKKARGQSGAPSEERLNSELNKKMGHYLDC